MNTAVSVSEGLFGSITEGRDGNSFTAPAPNGKFDLRAGPCDCVTLDFGAKGYASPVACFGSMSDVPKPFHIVLHKEVPTTIPIDRSPTGEYLATSLDYTFYGAFRSVILDLKADGIATTVTTLPDGKTKVQGTGTWKEYGTFRSHQVVLSIKQPVGSPDPALLSGKDIMMAASNDGLFPNRGGSNFIRIK